MLFLTVFVCEHPNTPNAIGVAPQTVLLKWIVQSALIPSDQPDFILSQLVAEPKSPAPTMRTCTPLPQLLRIARKRQGKTTYDQDVGCCCATHGSVRGGCSISSLCVAVPVVEWMGLAHSPCCAPTSERSPGPMRCCPTKTPTHAHGSRAFCRWIAGRRLGASR